MLMLLLLMLLVNCCRIFTFTYVALLFGLMGYNVELQGLDGFNSINNMLFTTVLIMLLMPYVGISLYTADKTMYIADASARRYRASAYYIAKVRRCFKVAGRMQVFLAVLEASLLQRFNSQPFVAT
jgi:sulfite exporter TauE/SafE